MTRSEKLARADEIFAHVWGRESHDAIEVAVCDLKCAADDMELMRDELNDPEMVEAVQSSLTTYASSFRQLAERLDALDFSERVA